MAETPARGLAHLIGSVPLATTEEVFRTLADERQLKPAALIHPARMAISGKTSGAGLFEMMEVLGRERVVARMRRAANG